MFANIFDFCDGGCSWSLLGLVGIEGEKVKKEIFSTPLEFRKFVGDFYLKKVNIFTCVG